MLTFLSEININQNWTKRTVLSAYSKLFDPLGFIAPIAIYARAIVQACWRYGIDWDDQIPDKFASLWSIWLQALVDLPKIRINRCIKPLTGAIIKEEVHIFSDASEDAFGAVAYLRAIQNDRANLTIIVSKAKVAPIKPANQTVNQLELRGCP